VAGGACDVHLAEVWPPASRREPCHGSRSERTDAGRVLPPARPVVGRAAQSCSALWLGHSRSSARCACGSSSVSAQKTFKD
jgi:hypothetical protein